MLTLAIALFLPGRWTGLDDSKDDEKNPFKKAKVFGGEEGEDGEDAAGPHWHREAQDSLIEAMRSLIAHTAIHGHLPEEARDEPRSAAMERYCAGRPMPSADGVWLRHGEPEWVAALGDVRHRR